MKNDSILFIGMDTYKEYNEAAYFEGQRGAEVKHLGRISSAKASLTKMAQRV